jgi:hypothetical protein
MAALTNSGTYPLEGSNGDVLMLIDGRFPNRRTAYIEPPRDWNMLVPDEIRKSVLFIGYVEPDDKGIDRPFFVGTTYLVTASDDEEEGGVILPHLVTARHVAKALEGKDVVLRINDKQGEALNIRAGQTLKWWYHPTDETVDAAVAPFKGVTGDEFDYCAMESELFLTDELVREQRIGAGDEVFLVGLFSHFIGRQRNIPIVRIGNVAMMPTVGERIPFGNETVEAHLIEVRSFGGLSGCPVFVRQTLGVAFQGHQNEPPLARRYMLSCGPFWFMGHALGHLAQELPGIDRYPHNKELDELNLGLALVVPASKIRETINHPELVQMRKEKYAERRAKSPIKGRRDILVPSQETKPAKGAPITIPIPTRDQFSADLEKATRRKP